MTIPFVYTWTQERGEQRTGRPVLIERARLQDPWWESQQEKGHRSEPGKTNGVLLQPVGIGRRVKRLHTQVGKRHKKELRQTTINRLQRVEKEDILELRRFRSMTI